MTAPTYFRLSFKTAAPFEAIRAFCADAVRVVRPSESGAWKLTSSVARPHEGHGPLAVLAHTTWALGSATLLQKVDGGDGSPRDGYGFDMSILCELAGDDGVPRKLQLSAGSWDPRPNSVSPELFGFTPAEFLAIRALGAGRFGNDETSNVTWCRANVETLVKCGAREAARTLALEGMSRTESGWISSSRRAIHKMLCELTDEPDARRAEEGRALQGDPTDVERLTRLAAGDLTLPGWTREAAHEVLRRMTPWNDSTNPALAHPWWSPAPNAPVLTNWYVATWQPVTSRRVEGRTGYLPDGDPKPLAHTDAVYALQRQLGISETVKVRELHAEVDRACEGDVLSLEPSVQVRGMAHRRFSSETEHTLWTWFFTGSGLEGAIVVSRLAAPFDAKGPALETQLLFVGEADTNKAKWLDAGRRILNPVRPEGPGAVKVPGVAEDD